MKKKLTAVLLTLSMIITLTFSVSIPAFASTSPTVTRLAGADRYSTATAIANQGWTQSDYAILTYGENYPDALSAAPLAKKYDAPILLTTSNSLPDITKQTLTGLKVKNIFIVGGTGVISTSVESELQSMGITVARIAGQDRYDTAIQVAKQVTTTPSSIFVTIGEDYPDALSVAPIAAMNQMPIILVPKDYIPDSIKNYIASSNISKTYVIGYSDIIDDSVANQFTNSERITGSDKYARNIAINQKFETQFNSKGACLATGEGFADALTGAVYASKISEPIVLVNNDSPSGTKGYYQGRIYDASKVYVFGGTGVVSDNVVSNLNTSLTTVTPIVPTTPVIPTTPIVPTVPTTPSVPTGEISFANPADLNAYQTISVTNSYVGDFTSQITVKQVIRGTEAWSKIKQANMFNSAPKDGYEYVMAYVDYKLLDISDGKALNLFGTVDFKLVSQDGRTYDTFYSVVEPDPQLNAKLYKGASSEGWVSFLVKTTDIKPVISYYVNSDGTGGAWFKGYNDSTSSNVITPITNTTTPTIAEAQQAILGTWKTPDGSNSYTLEFYNDGTFEETNYIIANSVSGTIIFDGTYSFSSSGRIRMVTTKSWLSVSNKWTPFSWTETDNIVLNGNQLTFDSLGGSKGQLVFTKVN